MSPITLIIAIPALAALVCIFLKPESRQAVRGVGIVAAGLTVVIALWMLFAHRTDNEPTADLWKLRETDVVLEKNDRGVEHVVALAQRLAETPYDGSERLPNVLDGFLGSKLRPILDEASIAVADLESPDEVEIAEIRKKSEARQGFDPALFEKQATDVREKRAKLAVRLRPYVARALNAAISDPSFFSPRRFPQTRLRGNGRDAYDAWLATPKPTGAEAVRLNRELLVAAYPGAIVVGLSPASAKSLASFQFTEKTAWVKLNGKAFISWHVGADGISVVMILLTAFVIFAGTLVSHTVTDRTKEFYILLLLLVSGVFGVFGTRDLFWFYFFYELAVIPMYLLIGVWGSGNKEYATMKLTLYLTTGALVAFVGLLLMVVQAETVLGYYTWDMGELLRASQHAAVWDLGFERLTFPMILIGFGAIVPMWPLHTWSPIGHAAAPSAASMLHAGVLMKLGGYGILRIGMTLLPAGALEWLPWVALICCMNIVYGGMVAMAQKDLKFIIGFSSSSHMGYVLLGLATMGGFGVTGAVFLMFAHGIMTALAFGLIGFFYDQTHTRWVPDLGGLVHQMPFVGTAFAIMTLASLGLPGFANFASELMVIFAAWGASDYWATQFDGAFASWSWHYTVAAVAAVWGIVVTATYLLRALRDVFYGPRLEKWDGIQDANTWFQRSPFIILIVVLTVTGCYPPLITDVIDSAVTPLVERIQEIAAVVGAEGMGG